MVKAVLKKMLADSHFQILSLLQSCSNQDSVVFITKVDITQWNRIESLEMNYYICGQLNFDQGAETIQWGK